MNISPSITSVLTLGAVVVGLIICFFGYRILRFVLAVTGFVIGASFVAGFGFTLTDGREIAVILIAGIAGGLITAAILLFLYSAGVFLLGALFGILLFYGVSAAMALNTYPALYVIPALAGGILAVLLQRFMIILITSFTGAWIVVLGSLYMINGGFDPLDPESLNAVGENEIFRIMFSWLALGVLGFVVQYLIFPKKARETQIEDT